MHNCGLGLEWTQCGSMQRPQNARSLPLMNHARGLLQLSSRDCTGIPTGQFILGQFSLKADPVGLLAATITVTCITERSNVGAW